MGISIGNSRKTFQLKITPSNASKKLLNVLPLYRRKWSQRIGRFKDDSHKALTSKVNSRSGRTVRAVKSVALIQREQMSAKVIIDYSATVIKFLDKGTRPSAGAYIPKFGRRYRKDNPNKKGIHPGIQAQFIVSRALTDIKDLKQDLARNLREDFRDATKGAFR